MFETSVLLKKIKTKLFKKQRPGSMKIGHLWGSKDLQTSSILIALHIIDLHLSPDLLADNGCMAGPPTPGLQVNLLIPSFWLLHPDPACL